MTFIEQTFAADFGLYTAGGIFILLILIVIMLMTRSFAPVGICLYLLMPFFNLSYKYKIEGINFQSVSIILFLGILCVYVLFSRKEEKSNGYYLTLVILFFYVLWVCFSTLVNSFSTQAIPDVLKSIILIPIFFGGYIFIYEPKNRTKNMLAYLMVINLITIIGYLQMMHIIPYTYHTYIGGEIVKRVTCGYHGPRVYISFVIIGLAFILYLTIVNKRTWVKIISWGSFAFWLPVIYLTYLRSGFIALLVLIMVYFILEKKTSMLVLFLGILVIGALLSAETLFEIFEHNLIALQKGNFERIGHNRFGIWIQIYKIYFGGPIYKYFIGYGAYPEINGNIMNDAHNDFVKVLFETGLVGFTFFYSFVVLCLRESIKCFRTHPDKEDRSLGLISVSLFITVGIYGISVRPSDYIPLLIFMISMASYIFVSNHKASRDAKV